MIAQNDSERDACNEADDVCHVSDLWVVAGYAALFVDDHDVIEEVKDRDESLRREKKPGELERSHEHDAACQRENGGRGTQHARAPGQKQRAEDEAHESAGEKDRQELPWADGLLQCSSEDK